MKESGDRSNASEDNAFATLEEWIVSRWGECVTASVSGEIPSEVYVLLRGDRVPFSSIIDCETFECLELGRLKPQQRKNIAGSVCEYFQRITARKLRSVTTGGYMALHDLAADRYVLASVLDVPSRPVVVWAALLLKGIAPEDVCECK